MPPVLVAHEQGCRYARPRDGGHSDAAKRISDAYNLHLTAGAAFVRPGSMNPNVGRFLAFRLADGGSDGVLYDSYRDAVRHQHHDEKWRMYCRIVPHSMSVCSAESQLYIHRLFYERGWDLPDIDDRNGGRAPILLESQENTRALVDALNRGDWIRLPERN